MKPEELDKIAEAVVKEWETIRRVILKNLTPEISLKWHGSGPGRWYARDREYVINCFTDGSFGAFFHGTNISGCCESLQAAKEEAQCHFNSRNLPT